MGQFRELEDFKRRFDAMDVEELRRWRIYWIQHAQSLGPKVRKLALKRVLAIDKAIHARSVDN
ncbi:MULTISPECIES: hypothetical protein [Dyella]|uniref:Uncharacterized protein n=2 Tax=Dyella TaxID=231454 RepID=A0A4R0YDR1_9GAMM|nr:MULTISPECIES: hypothetical protein [Dyella]TBR36085.1 hypothetical protein EYV96_15890 [Dyella terrae]TCI06134.1 hypothetical protein EZM97_34980 [Dyella soli]